jgi:hypothetical protein
MFFPQFQRISSSPIQNSKQNYNSVYFSLCIFGYTNFCYLCYLRNIHTLSELHCCVAAYETTPSAVFIAMIKNASSIVLHYVENDHCLKIFSFRSVKGSKSAIYKMSITVFCDVKLCRLLDG